MNPLDPPYTAQPHSVFFTSRRYLFSSLFIVFFGFVLYYNSLDVPFYLDDFRNISDNPHCRISKISIKGLIDAAFQSPIPTRPVANLSFALNYLFHRDAVAGYHLINIGIHIATGLFLFLLFAKTMDLVGRNNGKKISSPLTIALFAALLWLAHPIQTQSVTYIVQRMNSLASMFFVLSLLLYVNGRLAKLPKRSVFWFTGSFIAGVFSVFSKENGATLPFFIFLYEWYFFQDLRFSWLKRKLPVFLCAVLLVFILALYFTGGHPFSSILASYQHRDFTLGQRLLTEFRVVILYIGHVFYPHPARLSLEHDIALSNSLVDPITTLLSALALLALVFLAFFSARKERIFSFAIIWFLGNLIIESSIIGLEIIFEHRLYLPSMFVVLAAVLLIYRWLHYPRLRTVLLCAILLIFSFWTHERNETWRNPIRFWTDAADKAPGNPRVHNNLSVELRKAGKYPEAHASSLEALRLKSDFVNGYVSLGNIYLDIRSFDLAIQQFHRALALKPDYGEVYVNLGNTYMGKGETDKAIEAYSKALKHKSDNIEALVNLASANASKGLLDDAARGFRTALILSPENADIYFNLGLAYKGMGQYDKALKAFAEAVRLKPKDKASREHIKQIQNRKP